MYIFEDPPVHTPCDVTGSVSSILLAPRPRVVSECTGLRLQGQGACDVMMWTCTVVLSRYKWIMLRDTIAKCATNVRRAGSVKCAINVKYASNVK